MIKFTRCTAVLVFLLIVGVTGARAQATRTWVSGVGDDANPCSRTAPCKTFAGAISKTAAHGEINALDPGGFGAVTITKAITIDGGTGNTAGVLVSGTNGIVVSAGPGDVVILRNLDINGLLTGINGIQFNSGGSLYVENSLIYGFSQNGINFAPTGISTLSVDRTVLRTNGKGLLVQPVSPSGAASVRVAGSRFEGSTEGAGVLIRDNSEATISSSTSSGNVGNGFIANSTTNPIEVNLEGCISADNAQSGVVAKGAGAVVNMSNTLVTHNAMGVNAGGGGSLVSFVNNRIVGNTTDGAPTADTAQQ
jgi:Right handed beta helix region